MMEKENVDANAGASAPKKRRLSLSLKKHSRFADVSEETVESFACASVPKNSVLNSKWALHNFKKRRWNPLLALPSSFQARTGHSSLEALRKYERVTANQEQAVSKILTGEVNPPEKASSIIKQELDVSVGNSDFSASGGVQCKDCVVNVYRNS